MWETERYLFTFISKIQNVKLKGEELFLKSNHIRCSWAWIGSNKVEDINNFL